MYVIVKQYWYKQVLQGVTESRYIWSILFLPAKETLPPLHLSRLQVIVNHILKSYRVLVCAKFRLICKQIMEALNRPSFVAPEITFLCALFKNVLQNYFLKLCIKPH